MNINNEYKKMMIIFKYKQAGTSKSLKSGSNFTVSPSNTSLIINPGCSNALMESCYIKKIIINKKKLIFLKNMVAQ